MTLQEIRERIAVLKKDPTVLTGMRSGDSQVENADVAILELLDELVSHLELENQGLLRPMTEEERDLNKDCLDNPIFYDVTKGPLRKKNTL